MEKLAGPPEKRRGKPHLPGLAVWWALVLCLVAVGANQPDCLVGGIVPYVREKEVNGFKRESGERGKGGGRQ